MLGRDFLLLTHLLSTLGTFVTAVAPASETALVAGALLELLADPAVENHPQPSVRRAALAAAARVLQALPPAWVAGVIQGQGVGGGAGGGVEGRLVELLEWVRQWTGVCSCGNVFVHVYICTRVYVYTSSIPPHCNTCISHVHY